MFDKFRCGWEGRRRTYFLLFCLLLEKLWCLAKFRCGKGGRANEKQNLVSVLSHEKVSCFSRSATKKGLVREAEGRERHEMPTQNDSQAKKIFFSLGPQVAPFRKNVHFVRARLAN